MKASHWKNLLNTSLSACLLAVGCCAAQADDLDKPLLLVASPTLEGPYRRTTLVAVQIGGGHVGFILNRATDIKLSTVFPGDARAAKVTDPLYFGGPLRNDALFAVARRNPGKHSFALFSGLYVTSETAAIERIIRKTPNEARYFAGFVAWAPRELSAEIERGLWHVAEPAVDLVFRRDTSGLWEELVTRLGNGQAPRRGPVIQTRLGAGGWAHAGADDASPATPVAGGYVRWHADARRPPEEAMTSSGEPHEYFTHQTDRFERSLRIDTELRVLRASGGLPH
jgi:putative AlgH/UPF0301 family transcriptional regulator